MNIYFSSDTHWGHTNIAGPSVSQWRSGYRNFSSVEDMNEALIESYNSHIKANDILYFLGDWSFGGYQNVEKFRRALNVKDIRALVGNHDNHIRKNPELQKLFTWVKPVFNGKIGNKFFCLNHYAQRIWEHSHHGSYHLYGHSHASLPDDPNSLSIDAGIDTELYGHEYFTPYHIDEIEYIMTKYKSFVPVDHHSESTT